MATLEATVTLRDTTRGYALTASQSTTSADDHRHCLSQSIGTTEEEITLHSDITGGNGPGWCKVENLDDTNYVQVGIATTSYFARLAAGDSMLLPLDAGVASLFLKANTAACIVDVDIWER